MSYLARRNYAALGDLNVDDFDTKIDDVVDSTPISNSGGKYPVKETQDYLSALNDLFEKVRTYGTQTAGWESSLLSPVDMSSATAAAEAAAQALIPYQDALGAALIGNVSTVQIPPGFVDALGSWRDYLKSAVDYLHSAGATDNLVNAIIGVGGVAILWKAIVAVFDAILAAARALFKIIGGALDFVPVLLWGGAILGGWWFYDKFIKKSGQSGPRSNPSRRRRRYR